MKKEIIKFIPEECLLEAALFLGEISYSNLGFLEPARLGWGIGLLVFNSIELCILVWLSSTLGTRFYPQERHKRLIYFSDRDREILEESGLIPAHKIPSLKGFDHFFVISEQCFQREGVYL